MKVHLFGTAIQETKEAFRPHFGTGESDPKQDRMKAIARIVISIILLGIAVYLLLNTPEEENKTLPSTIIGGIIGYWLK
jgi:hypothetical protein